VYEVQLASRRVEKAIAGLPPTVREPVLEAIKALSEEPRPRGVKKLSGKLSGSWRIRVGAYRVLYDIYDAGKVVMITDVGPRKGVYR
jgi:mRNA interferase RelE/StbE